MSKKLYAKFPYSTLQKESIQFTEIGDVQESWELFYDIKLYSFTLSP